MIDSLFKRAMNASPEDKKRQKGAFNRQHDKNEKERKATAPLSRVLLYSNLSQEDFKTKKFELFNRKDSCALQLLKNLTPEDKFGLCLHGDVGTGKTHLLKGFIIEHSTNFRTYSYFTSLHDLMNDFRANLDDLVHFKNKLFSYDVLVIDDVGAENTTDFVTAELTSIMDRMTVEGKMLLMSSNYTPTKLKEIYGFRIFDRMIEQIQFINCVGTTYRATIYRNNKKKLDERLKK